MKKKIELKILKRFYIKVDLQVSRLASKLGGSPKHKGKKIYPNI